MKFTALIIAAALIAACGSQQPTGGAATSLVSGTVAAGPVSPGARPGAPANRAVRGATVEALHAGQVIATVHTDAAGRYALRLAPGTYLIRAQSDKYLSKEQDRTVTVSGGQKVRVNFVFSTGIS